MKVETQPAIKNGICVGCKNPRITFLAANSIEVNNLIFCDCEIFYRTTEIDRNGNKTVKTYIPNGGHYNVNVSGVIHNA